MPELIFYVVAENKERPHIADQVHPAAVQEHAAKQGEYFVGTKLLKEKQWNQPKILEKNFQSVVAKRNFKQEYDHVYGDDQICDFRQ